MFSTVVQPLYTDISQNCKEKKFSRWSLIALFWTFYQETEQIKQIEVKYFQNNYFLVLFWINVNSVMVIVWVGLFQIVDACQILVGNITITRKLLTKILNHETFLFFRPAQIYKC